MSIEVVLVSFPLSHRGVEMKFVHFVSQRHKYMGNAKSI